MTPEQLKEIERRASDVEPSEHRSLYQMRYRDIPLIIAEVKRLREELKQVRAETLEEAAKEIENTPGVGYRLSQKIRALKEKE